MSVSNKRIKAVTQWDDKAKECDYYLIPITDIIQTNLRALLFSFFVPVKKVSLYSDTVWILLIMQVFIKLYFLIHGAEMYYSCKNMVTVTG
jgi:hypothetical protein